VTGLRFPGALAALPGLSGLARFSGLSQRGSNGEKSERRCHGDKVAV
jgi:hypothetical protein